MPHPIHWLFERITGRPYITSRSMTAEFGPPPAVRYPELASYSDAELMARPLHELIAEIQAARGEIDPATAAALVRVSIRLRRADHDREVRR